MQSQSAAYVSGRLRANLGRELEAKSSEFSLLGKQVPRALRLALLKIMVRRIPGISAMNGVRHQFLRSPRIICSSSS